MLTQEELKRLFHYDPETGVFTRLVTVAGNAKKGYVAGFNQMNGCGKKYLAIRIKEKTYLMHRLAWLYITGNFPENQIDHINGNGCDNRLLNLRSVNSTENHQNIRRRIDNTSGLTGVYWDSRDKLWYARIYVEKIQKNLGFFNNIFDAVCARKNAEIKYGFHKNHGTARSL